jgi:hypothetical protein
MQCNQHADFLNVTPGGKGKGEVHPRTGHEGPQG